MRQFRQLATFGAILAAIVTITLAAGTFGVATAVPDEQSNGVFGLTPTSQARQAPSVTLPAGPSTAADHPTGAQPYVVVLCRFAESAGNPPHEPPWYRALLTSPGYPSADNYWREVSYDRINLAGTDVVGWYRLPQPRASYVYDEQNPYYLNLDRLAHDCLAAADGDVFFPKYTNIGMFFDQDLTCCAMSVRKTYTLDGATRAYGIFWMGSTHELPDVLHEMGHTFGLPHSSGPYEAVYDSRWDLMSSYGGKCPPTLTSDGPDAGPLATTLDEPGPTVTALNDTTCRAPHLIAFHKDLVGWIPPAEQYVHQGGSRQITLERLALPTSNNIKIAKIALPNAPPSTAGEPSSPIPSAAAGQSPKRYYTVEARQRVGYDRVIPADGVVIHLVDLDRGDRKAQVVDVDRNGNPNDAGAVWTPGETFVDAANGIRVAVLAATPSGYVVDITTEAAGH